MTRNQLSAQKQQRLNRVREILNSCQRTTAREIADVMGISAPLVNVYLNQLEVAGEAFIVGSERRYTRGGISFIWSSKRKPWYCRVWDWLTGDSDVRVPA